MDLITAGAATIVGTSDSQVCAFTMSVIVMGHSGQFEGAFIDVFGIVGTIQKLLYTSLSAGTF